MATTYKGTVVWWGSANGGTLTVTIGSARAMYANSINVTRTSEVKWIPNGQGATAGGVFYDHKKTVRFTGVPYAAAIGGSGATIGAVVEGACPAAGTQVTLANSYTDDIDGVNTGKYICLSSTQNRTSNGELVVDLDLIQFEDADLSDTIAA